MKTIARIDFGNAEFPVQEGYYLTGRVYCSPRFLWINEPREVWRAPEIWKAGVEDSLLLSFLQAQRGEFRMGLPAGSYRLRLSFYDLVEEHGPFTLAVASCHSRSPAGAGEQRVVLAGVVIPRDQVITEEVDVSHTGGSLALRFSAPAGKNFMINGLEVFGPDDAETQLLFPDAPTDVLRSPEEIMSAGSDDPRAALRQVCDWLMAHRGADGFLGDTEGRRRWWYTSAYPIRTLLAGSRIFGEERYLAAACDILDLFVLEQMPEGGFPQSMQGRGELALLPKEDLDEIRARNLMNLADIGSSVSSLAFACQYVSGERRTRYAAALRRYLGPWARQYQQPSGGFTNGRLSGHDAQWIYSVATGTTALAFAFFGAVTGEQEYLRIAERAAGFLVRDWNPDGRPYFWPFDGFYPGHPYYMRVTDLGEQFYVLDAIVGVASVSRNRAVHKGIFEAMRAYLLGGKGLIATWNGAVWWPIQDVWHNSKSAATPLFLQWFLRVAAEFGLPAAERSRVEAVYPLARRFLCTPDDARAIGVMADDPELPWGGHSLASWTCRAVAATGFAGLALADMVEPGISYPHP